MRQILRAAIILTPALLCSGCIILPIPHQRVHEYGVEGRITKPDYYPIAGARVASASDENTFVISDAEGKFHLPAKYGWHGGMLFGSICFSIWPGLDVVFPKRKITISAEGYESMEAHLGESGQWIEVDGDNLKPAPIKLSPTPPSHPAKSPVNE